MTTTSSSQQTTAGHQEMRAVRQSRRYTLCYVLTAIGVIFLCALGGFSLYDGSVLLGSILLANAAVGLFNLYLLKRSNNVERAAIVLSGILFTLSMTLLTA